MKWFDYLLITVIVVLTLVVSCNLANDIFELKSYIQDLYHNDAQLETLIQEKCKETEENCSRMTDTCIDILINGRWE